VIASRRPHALPRPRRLVSGAALALLTALVVVGCRAHSGAPATASACSGANLSLDRVLARCLLDGLSKATVVVPPEAVELQVSLRPPSTEGGAIGVLSTVRNVTDQTLELHVVTQEIQPDPWPLLLQPSGFRVEQDLDESCTDWRPAGGGLGVRDVGRAGVARVVLPPGGSLTATREVPARKALCRCGPNEEGVLDIQCEDGVGGPVAPGDYFVGVSMPVAVERRDGANSPYTYPYAKAPILIAESYSEPWE